MTALVQHVCDGLQIIEPNIYSLEQQRDLLEGHVMVHRAAGALEIHDGKMARKQKGRQLRAQPDFHLGRDWLRRGGWELCLLKSA